MDLCPQSSHRLPRRPAKTTFLLLRWLGVSWAMGGLISPQFLVPAVAQPLPLETAPPAAPEPVIEPTAPISVAEPIEPIEPVAPPPMAAPVEPSPPSFTEPTTPAPAPVVQDPEPVDTYGDTYIDPHDYGIGATPSQPYVQTNDAIETGYGYGCQGISQARPDLANSLCAPAPSPTTYAQEPTRIYGQESPRSSFQTAFRTPNYSSNASSPYPVAHSAVAIRGSRASDHGPRSYRLPYKITPLYQGSNPLSWLQPNGQQMLFPLSIPAAITSAFGWRLHPISGTQRFHAGADLAAPMGTPVLSAYAGKVAIADWMGGYGLSVLLEHAKGQSATRYAHLSEIFVQPGQVVQQGTVIGLVGSTGNSTGPHLHFETLQASKDGLVSVDPGVPLKISLTHLINTLHTARLIPAQ